MASSIHTVDEKHPICGQCLMRLFWCGNVATKLILKISVRLLVGTGSFWTAYGGQRTRHTPTGAAAPVYPSCLSADEKTYRPTRADAASRHPWHTFPPEEKE